MSPIPAQAGSAYIPIRPDLTGFHKTIQKELQAALGPIIAKLAKQIGADLKDGIGQGLGDPISGPLEESTQKRRRQAPKDGDQIGGAFAGAFKRRVTDALKSLPKAEITADSTDADRKVAELRGRLDELSKKTIGIDIDSATALEELGVIKDDLAQVSQNATIDVRADTAAAIRSLEQVQATVEKFNDHPTVEVDADTAGADAALAVTNAEVDKLDGRKASIDIDTDGAISGLARMSGVVAGLGPLFLGAGAAGMAAIGSLAAPAAAAGAGFGALALVAVPAITRIKTALDAQTQAQANSAQTSLQAQQRALALAGANQQLAAAVRNAAVAHQQALDQVRSAEQQLASAQQSAASAQLALTQARLDARRALEDMKNQVIDLGLAAQQSQLDLDRARIGLNQMRTAATQAAQQVTTTHDALARAQAAQQALNRDPAATDAAKAQAQANVDAAQAALNAAQAQKRARDLDLKSAEVAYQQQIQRLKEQQTQLKRLQDDERKASKAGVDGSNAVLAARQRLAAANLQITNSERALAAARANVARTDQNSRDQIASAQRAVTQASLQGAAANATLAQSMAALSPAARGLMAAWQQLSAAFKTWQTAMEPTVLPVLARGLHLVQGMLPLLTPLVIGAARAMDTLITSVQAALASPAWQTFFATLGGLVQGTMTTLGNILIQVATSVVRLTNAFAPFAPIALGVLTQLGNLISVVLNQVGGLAPSLAPFLGVLGQLVQALGPLLVAALQGLSPVLAGLAPIFGVVIRALQPVVAALIAGLRPVLVALVPVVGLVIGALGRILDALAPILPVLGQFIGSLVAGLLPVLTPIINLIAQVAAQMAGALIMTLKAALPSVQQIVLAVASLLPALLPLIPALVQWDMAMLPLLPPLTQLLALIVTALVPVLRLLISVIVKLATGTLMDIYLPAMRVMVAVTTFVINAVRVLLTGIIIVVRALGTAVMWLWHNVIVPAFTVIATVGKVMAAIVLFAVLAPLVVAFRVLQDVVLFLWHNAIVPAWHGIAAVAKWAWDTVLHPVFSAIVRFLNATLGPVFRWLWHNVIDPVWHGIRKTVEVVWTDGIRPAFNAIKSALSAVGHAFEVAGSAIKTAWNKVKGYVAAPVRFFVETVYDKGIVGLWNSVMGWLHLGKTVGTLTPLHVPGLASGGELSAAQPIRPMVTNGPMAIVGEGNPAWPEYVIPTDPKHRDRATALWSAAGGDLQMLAGGGILGDVVKGIKGVAGKVLNLGKDALSLLANPKGIWDKLAAPILNKMKGVGSGDWGKAIAAVPPKLLGDLWNAAKTIIGTFKDSYGGGGSSMVELAKSQIGYHEGPGNSNKYSHEIGRPSEEWCADFIDWLAMKTGNRSAVPWTASAPGMARAFGGRYQSGTAGAGPGDILFFGPSKAGIYHVGLASGPARGGVVPTIAGNSSNMVRAYTGTGIAGYAHPNYPHPGSLGSAPGSLVHASPARAKEWARQNLGTYGWSQAQFGPLERLWTRESGWRWSARNPGSGAYGIPQSLPASKMRSAGSDWRDNAGTQIKWGLGYIRGRYGSPAGAWAHSQHTGWYDDGGLLQPGLTLAYNATRKPEPVLTSEQWSAISAAAQGGDGSTTHNTYNLHHRDITLAQLEALQRRRETLDRMGRPH